MVSKDYTLKLIQGTLLDLGFSDISERLAKEVNEQEGVEQNSELDEEKRRLLWWMKRELTEGRFEEVAGRLLGDLEHHRNGMSVDEAGEIRNASYSDVLGEMQDKVQGFWISIYLVRRALFLDSLVRVVFSGANDGDVVNGGVVGPQKLLSYLKEELIPILDQISVDTFEDERTFSRELVESLTTEKESDLLLPIVMQSTTSRHSVSDSLLFNSRVMLSKSAIEDTGSDQLRKAIRKVLVEDHFGNILHTKVKLNERLNFELPQNYLNKLLDDAFNYQKLRSIYYLPPRFSEEESPVIDLSLDGSNIDEIHKPLFPTKLLTVLTGHSNEVWSAKFSPSGKYLVTGSLDGRLIVYSVMNSFKIIKVLESTTAMDQDAFVSESKKPVSSKSNAVIYCCWDPDERYIVSCCLDTIVRVWELGDLSLSTKRKTRSMDFVEDSSKLLCCFTMGVKIKTWTCEFLPGNSERPIFIIGSPDKRLKAYSIDGREIFDFYGNTEDGTEDRSMRDDSIEEDTSDRNNVAGAGKSVINEEPINKSIHEKFIRINDLCVTPDGKYLVTATNDKQIHFFTIPDLSDQESTTNKLASISLNGRPSSCSMSANGKYVLVSIAPEELQIWDISSLERHERPILARKFIGHNQSSYMVRSAFGYLADGEEQLIISGSDDGYIYFWKLGTGQLITRVKGHEGLCNSVDWNRFYIPSNKDKDYGKLWCSIGDDKLVKIWGPQDWE